MHLWALQNVSPSCSVCHKANLMFESCCLCAWMHLTLNPFSLLTLVNISKSSTVLVKLTLTNEDSGANGALSLWLALVCILMIHHLQHFPEAMRLEENFQLCKDLFWPVSFLIFPHPLPVNPLELHNKKFQPHLGSTSYTSSYIYGKNLGQ